MKTSCPVSRASALLGVLALGLLLPRNLVATEEFPQIRVQGAHFVDPEGGLRIFRGVNVTGSAKRPLPPPDRETLLADPPPLFEARPIAVEEADEHFSRLASWGFDLIRLVVTWEAIEPRERGIYDEAYLDNLVRLVDRAAAHGLWVVIDPHQDTWSRFTGGDGAPRWTLEDVGFDLDGLIAGGGAVVEEMAETELAPMTWPTNYTKLGSATLFTLFFGGNDFAPASEIDGRPVQEVLQEHFLAAFGEVARRLADRPNVLGYEVLNEPHPGFIGLEDLTEYAPFPLRIGPTPTPFEALRAGEGLATEVALWKVGLAAIEEDGKTLLNADGRRAWSRTSVWEENGVIGRRGEDFELVRPKHFSEVDGRQVDFAQDYFRPFIERYIERIREHDPEAIVFVVPAFEHGFPTWQPDELDNVASGIHFYDQVTLVKKLFLPWLTLDLRSGAPVWGREAVAELFDDLASSLSEKGAALGGPTATFVGETGIPFDLNGARAFESRDYSAQNLALDRSLGALERQGFSYAIWNYTPDNRHAGGDHWNGEDLSIFSLDDLDLHLGESSGGRGLRAAVRPSASRIAGQLERVSFDISTARFELEVIAEPSFGETRVRLPQLPYPDSPTFEVSSGDARFDPSTRILIWTHGVAGLQELWVEPLEAPPPLDGRPPTRPLLALFGASILLYLIWRLWRGKQGRLQALLGTSSP